jgi:hypothetical protein
MKRWFFWILAPIMLATGFGLPFLAVPPNWQGQVVLYVVCGTLVLATLALSAPGRFRWAVKGVAAVVLLTYVAYAATEALAWWQGKPFGFGAGLAQGNLFNALQGLVVVGVPSVYLLLTGRSRSSVDVLLGVDEEQAADAGSKEAGEQDAEPDNR